MLIVVGSQNPVKQEAVIRGFRRFFKEAIGTVEGVAVPSGVAEQPMSDEETRRGARQRAQNAQQMRPQADFWVGLEGGVQKIGNDWFSFAWVAIRHARGQWGLARSGSFLLPPKIAALLQEGYELGVADDMVFGLHNSKQQMGAVGLLTANAIDRAALYEHAVVLALIPFGQAWREAAV